jgi:16S rRNA (guanine527-N7)-methyltransferase
MISADKQVLENLSKLGITPTGEQLALLEKYAAIVLQKNAQLNITAAGDIKEIWSRHVADGLCALLPLRPRLAAPEPLVADLGAGAGFTGITLKIMLPRIKLILADSVERKCAFLNWACITLGLGCVKVICKRLDARNPPFAADFVLERAMGQFDDIAPVCLAATAPGGYFIAYQRPGGGMLPSDGKCPAAQRIDEITYTIPPDETPRTLVVFKRI